MEKIISIIILVCLCFLVGCSRKNPVVIRELTKEKYKSISEDKSVVKCELFIEGTKKYKEIKDIETRKLKKIKREAKECDCNRVYLDFNEFLGKVYDGEFFFLAVCVKESTEIRILSKDK